MTAPSPWPAMVHVGKVLGAAGLTPGTTGNISVRQGAQHGFVTSGTGTRLAALGENDWSVVDDEGSLVSGVTATKEARLHAAIYGARPDAGAIVHLHSPAALAVSCAAGLAPLDPLPPYTPYFVMRVRGLAVVDYVRPGHPALATKTAEALREVDAVLLRRHGLVTLGATLDDAVAAAEELESACAVHLRFADLTPDPLSTDEIAQLRE